MSGMAKNSHTARSLKSLAGRIGAYAQHARHDPRETTAAARATFAASFLDKVDPDHVLPLAERTRRAEAARREFYARIALASAKSRASRHRRSK